MRKFPRAYSWRPINHASQDSESQTSSTDVVAPGDTTPVDDCVDGNADDVDNTYYPSIGDVCKTRAVLHQLGKSRKENDNGIGLPTELVDMIIDEAEYWPSVLTRMPRPVSAQNDTDKQCLLTPPLCYDLGSDSSFSSSFLSPKLLPHRGPHPCRKIVFTIQAHDQGWGGKIYSRGTYQDSYTWFDAYILDGNAPAEPERPFTPTSCRLQSNRVAVKETQRYHITWHYSDAISPDSKEASRIELKEGRGSETLDGSEVRSMKLGDTVSVWARARFPGWVNYVKSASLRVFWAI